MTYLEQRWASGRRTAGDFDPRGGRGRSESAIGYQLYATPRNSGDADYYRPRTWQSGAASNWGSYDRDEVVGLCRQLYCQIGNIAGGVNQKSIYSIGHAWKPQFCGDDDVWGGAAEEWLHHAWLPNCSTRAGIFDWYTELLLTSIALDVEGDDAAVFTTDDNGFPKIQFVEGARINRGWHGEQKGGPNDGAQWIDGILTDPNTGAMLAISVNNGARRGLDDNATIIPARNCDLSFEPHLRGFNRGIPTLAVPLLDGLTVQDLNHYLAVGVKQDASIGLLITNERGAADTGRNYLTTRETAAGDTTTPTDIRIEKKYAGEYWYMRAGSNEKVESFKSDRPSPNTEAFIQRIERRIFAAMGWFYELLDPTDNKGANVRLIQDQARHSILQRQVAIRRRAKRMVQYAVAVAMDRGYIPENRNADDFLKWTFELPPMLTVDAGYDEQADRENYLLGITTLSTITAKKGKWWEDTRAQRLKENNSLIEAAAQLVAFAKTKGHDLTIREALDMMQHDGRPQRAEPPPDEPNTKPAESGKARK